MYRAELSSALLLAFACSCVLAAGPNDTHSVPIRTHSLYAPYVDQDLQNRWFDFGGDAIVNTNKHIRLTQDRPHEMGWLWSRLPLSSDNFELEIGFSIDGQHGHLYGDGMAVWLTTARAQPGPVFGSVDQFEGFGLLLDTFPNSKHPYTFPRIIGMMGDGTKEYDLGNDGASSEAGACSASIRRSEITTKLRITYVKDGYLEVAVHYKNWDQWTPCFRLEKPRLPARPYLGFSALTGDVSDAHDIIYVSASSFVVQSPQSGRRNPTLHRKPSSGWSTFWWRGFGIFVVGLLLLGVYRVYNQKVASKRF